jgi:SAM-dependent methyltransferase
MRLSPLARCPSHKGALHESADRTRLLCAEGCEFPVRFGIPRFVPSEGYAAAFGKQWKIFARTQLDSVTGQPISRQRLERCVGSDLGLLRGKSVLEVGCGAGRFTEILLDSGADVFACDLSTAVEANHANWEARDRYFVCQADVLNLPTAPQNFDLVLCIGVIQHTPDPEATIRALAQQVKPGGLLVIDHYAHGSNPLKRRVLRRLLLQMPNERASRAALFLARALLPLHRLLWHRRDIVGRLRRALGRISPLVDYYDAYPQLDPNTLGAWCILDTHDLLTDVYKHVRNESEIRQALLACGLEVIAVGPGGNGVEARARRPLLVGDVPAASSV